MTKEDQRDIQRKLCVLQHAERTGHVAKTCCYFGIGRASFYRWKRAFERDGEGGLADAKGDVDLVERLDEWERFYNFHRPHGAFKGKTPYEALREKP